MSSSSQGPCSVQTQLQVASNAGAAMGHAHTSRRSGGPRSCLGGLLVKMSHLPLVGQFAALWPSCWPEPETPGWCLRVAVQSEGPAKTPWRGATACASHPERPRHHLWDECCRLKPPSTVLHPGALQQGRGVSSRGLRMAATRSVLKAAGDAPPAWDASLVSLVLHY